MAPALLSTSTLLFASWANMMLYAIELTLCFYCLTGWRAFRSTTSAPESQVEFAAQGRQAGAIDTTPAPFQARLVEGMGRGKGKVVGSKWFIISTLVNDTVCTIVVCLDTFFVLRISKSASFDPRLWSTAIWVLTTFLATSLEQSYFLRRYWTLTRNKIITSILALLMFSNFIFVLVLDIMLTQPRNQPLILEKFDAPFVSAIITTVIDISLSFVLVWKLKSVPIFRLSTQRLLHKVCAYVVAYGCITTISSVLLLVMWLVNVNGYMSIAYCLGRIYSLTVLCNLLIVAGWRADATGSWNELSEKGSEQNLPDDIDFARLGIDPVLLPAARKPSQCRTQSSPDAPAFSVDTI